MIGLKSYVKGPEISPGSIEAMANSGNFVSRLQVVFYQRIADPECDWQDQSDWSAVEDMLVTLTEDFKGLKIDLEQHTEPSEIIVRGYTDILNSIRLRCSSGGFSNVCLGHVIGCSVNRDIAEDLKRGINRILFAPETIEPQGSDKVVCHNCGCGC